MVLDGGFRLSRAFISPVIHFIFGILRWGYIIRRPLEPRYFPNIFCGLTLTRPCFPGCGESRDAANMADSKNDGDDHVR